jgi:hypothetical protein
MSNPKIHYISFCSEGEPYDKGLNLSNSKQMLTDSLKDTDITYSFYSPRILRERGYGDFVKEHENAGLVSMNPGLNYIGFCAWKPVIMLLELEKLNDGDILVYRDCNCEKYPQLKDFDHFHENVNQILKMVNFDFFMPADEKIGWLEPNTVITIGHFCKSSVIRDLAVDAEFTRKSPLLIANTIICRKTPVSIEILEDWKRHCMVDEYINGEQYGELYPEFQWYTPEQGILSVLISNYVHEGKYNIPKNYPNVVIENRELSKAQFIDSIIVGEKTVENFDTIHGSWWLQYLPYIIILFIILFLGFLVFRKEVLNQIKKMGWK